MNLKQTNVQLVQYRFTICEVSPEGLDWIVQCFTSPPTQYRLYGRR